MNSNDQQEFKLSIFNFESKKLFGKKSIIHFLIGIRTIINHQPRTVNYEP